MHVLVGKVAGFESIQHGCHRRCVVPLNRAQPRCLPCLALSGLSCAVQSYASSCSQTRQSSCSPPSSVHHRDQVFTTTPAFSCQ